MAACGTHRCRRCGKTTGADQLSSPVVAARCSAVVHHARKGSHGSRDRAGGARGSVSTHAGRGCGADPARVAIGMLVRNDLIMIFRLVSLRMGASNDGCYAALPGAGSFMGYRLNGAGYRGTSRMHHDRDKAVAQG